MNRHLHNGKLLFLIPYFGRWPAWINFFIESCKYNPGIDWLIFTDCDEPQNQSANVHYEKMSFEDYRALISSRLEIDYQTDNGHKLCDLKPAYGYIHEQQLQGYSHFGFGDLDIIYGDILHHLAPAMLKYNLISTHSRRLAGHLCIMKNTAMMRNAFRGIKDWQTQMSRPDQVYVDERHFSKLFLRHKKYPCWLRRLSGFVDPYQRSALFREQYSTPESKIPWTDGSFNYPRHWYWHRGKLTTDISGQRDFLYLHFASWKYHYWGDLKKLVNVDYQDRAGWSISRDGFWPIEY